MSDFFRSFFHPSPDEAQDGEFRRRCGVLSSVVGILLNVLLFAGKYFAGVMTGSLSLMADAVNNLSDAGSSVISWISCMLAAQPADREHPFGHARIEYVASMIVSFLILKIGLDLIVDSFRKILHPEPTTVTPAVLWILGASIAVKLGLFLFNRSLGRRIRNSVITATAMDSLSDAAATAAVLISMLILSFWGVDIDGYMGVLVSVMILIAGIRILNETKNSILGESPDEETLKTLHRVLSEYPEVLGVHDILVHNYGPGHTIASLHAEVDGSRDIYETHDMIDNIERRLVDDYHIQATIHMDPLETANETVFAARERAAEALRAIDPSLSLHDFRMVTGATHTNLIFDVVCPFECKIPEKELRQKVSQAISAIDPSWFAVIRIDRA